MHIQFNFKCLPVKTKILNLFVLLISISGYFSAYASCNLTDKDIKALAYIDKYKDIAISEQERMGVPVSIKLAQGMLESNFGESRLATEGNNHFGIKCKSIWKGDTILINDDAPQECFRRYNSVYESYIDHSNFLKFHPIGKYKSLFNLPLTDYKSWAKGLKKEGYATNAQYSESLIQLIETYRLYEYDNPQLLAIIKPPITPPQPIYQQIQTPSNANQAPVVAYQPVQPKQLEPAETNSNNNHYQSYKNLEAQNQNVAEAKLPKYIKKDNNVIGWQQFYINNVKAVISTKDVYATYIAEKFKIRLRKVFKYNDLKYGEEFKAGSPIYLKAKKNKAASGIYTYIAQDGDTMHSISQAFGIKQSKLYKLNKNKKYEPVMPGNNIKLR